MNARTVFLRRLIGKIRQAGEIEADPGRAARTLGRREFISGVALAGAGVLTGCASRRPAGPVEEAKSGAVAIVGGGVAGLTAAYRLQQHGVEVHLFEASQRLGGRMWTKRNFNDDRMFCELGGELVDTNHTALRNLAAEIGVGIQPLRAGRETGGEYYFIDGTIYTEAQIVPAFAPLAKRLAADAAGLYTAGGAFTEKAHAFDRTRLSDYLRDAVRAMRSARRAPPPGFTACSMWPTRQNTACTRRCSRP